MSDDIEAQEYNVHENILDGLISRSRKIELIKSSEKCNGADEIIQLDKLVHDLVNSKVENLPCYGSLTKLKELIKLEDEKLISEFFDYCAKLCIEEEKLELMCVVTILLQDFINIPLYKSPVSRLIKRLTYVKVPSKWCEKNEFKSINENLYGYKAHNVHNLKPSIIDRFQTIPQHHTTLCYSPLPGLFSYPEDSSVLNILFPHKISPFAKFIITYSDDAFQPNNASSEIIDSPLFYAIIKFKWRSFTCYRIFIQFSLYLAFFAFFSASIITNYMSLHTISAIMGTIRSLHEIRYVITMYISGRSFTPITFFILTKAILPTITIFMGIFEVNYGLLIYFRSISILFLWFSVIWTLMNFKEIGIISIVIAHICRKILWLFAFLVLNVLAASHATVTYSNMMLNYDKTSLTDETRTKLQDLTQYYNSLNAYWSAFLSDYSSWPRDDPFVSITKVAYSFFITVMILNLMIALVNNIYSEVLDRAYTEWSMIRAQFIVYTELNLMTPSERQNKDYFPWTIFYEVFTEEVERWHKKLEEDNISISRNKIQLLNEMADKMKDEIIKMEDDDVIKTTMIDKLNELKQLFSKK
ncbi:hypothetical protein RhiirA4_452946 [Rhizophagus irregularis]|uniref:Ion transport domain-containing protein n=1 Tax=Rhizophagus irregularis TaxID=588596 RepID=A0A2I1FZ93_9GLOM|nr:hypothetical protein RhiirA4_452946 [Rhizophagus irregularis]